MMSRPLYSLTAVPMKRSAKSGAVTLPTQADGLPAGFADRSHRLLRGFSVEIVDDHARAFARELQRNRATDAAARAGDERNLAVEFECHGKFS